MYQKIPACQAVDNVGISVRVNQMKEVWVKPEIRKAFEEKLKECHSVCQKRTTKEIPLPKVVFARLGTTAGRADTNRNWVIINPNYFDKHYDEQLNDTLPHEFAHLVAIFLYGLPSRVVVRKVRGIRMKRLRYDYHGEDWRLIMTWLGQPLASRCHTFDDSKARLRSVDKPFRYSCGCKDFFHDVTGRVHKKEQLSISGGYKCKRCKRPITFIGTVVNGEFKPKGTPNTPTISLPVSHVSLSQPKRVQTVATHKKITVFENGMLVNKEVPI